MSECAGSQKLNLIRQFADRRDAGQHFIPEDDNQYAVDRNVQNTFYDPGWQDGKKTASVHYIEP